MVGKFCLFNMLALLSWFPPWSAVASNSPASYSWDFRKCIYSTTDSVGGHLSAVPYNGARCSPSGINMDGNDQYVAIDNFEFGSPASFEVLVKYHGFNSDSRLFDFGDVAGNDNVRLYNDGSSPSIRYGFATAASGGVVEVGGGGGNFNPAGSWSHVVVTHADPGGVKVYKNGLLVDSLVAGVKPLSLNTRARHYLGRPVDNTAPPSSAYFNGTVAFLNVYQAELSSVEVASLSAITLSSLPQDATNCQSFQDTNSIKPSNKWQLQKSSIIRQMHTATAMTESRVLLYGGISRTGSRVQVSEDANVYIYDAATFALQPYPTISFDGEPKARFGHAAWTWRGSQFTFGGFTQNYQSEIWRLDVPGFVANNNATWRPVHVSTSSTTTAPRVYGHSSTPIHTSNSIQIVVVFGGTAPGGIGSNALNLLLLEDAPTTGTCNATALPASESCSDYIVARRDTVANWKTIDSSSLSAVSPKPRSAHSASAPKGSLCTYVFGGFDPQTGDIYGDLWRLCPDLPKGEVLFYHHLFASHYSFQSCANYALHLCAAPSQVAILAPCRGAGKSSFGLRLCKARRARLR